MIWLYGYYSVIIFHSTTLYCTILLKVIYTASIYYGSVDILKLLKWHQTYNILTVYIDLHTLQSTLRNLKLRALYYVKIT